MCSGRGFSFRDWDNVSKDGAGEVGWVSGVVAGFRDDVFIPRLRGEANDGKITWDFEFVLSGPSEASEEVTGAGRDDRGGWVLEAERSFKNDGDVFGGALFEDRNNGVKFVGLRAGPSKARLSGMEPGKISLGSKETDAAVAVSPKEGSCVEGGSSPVFVD